MVTCVIALIALRPGAPADQHKALTERMLFALSFRFSSLDSILAVLTVFTPFRRSRHLPH